MTAIYKKELRSLMTNMTGAIAAASALLVTGLMFRYYNLFNGLLTLHYAVSGSMLLMGGGVGLAALGSSIAFITNSLKNIPL